MANTDDVHQKIIELGDKLEDKVNTAVDKAIDKRRDPYRAAIHFFAGNVSTCVVLILGLIAGFPDKTTVDYENLTNLIGAVLIAFTIAGAINGLLLIIVQIQKSAAPDGVVNGGSPTYKPAVYIHFLMGIGGVATLIATFSVIYLGWNMWGFTSIVGV